MLNRMSALWLVIGALGGYAIAGPSVTAQNAPESPRPAFVRPGDEVWMQIDFVQNARHIRCAVAEIQGIWIRCAPRDKFASNPKQNWFSLNRVIAIDIPEK